MLRVFVFPLLFYVFGGGGLWAIENGEPNTKFPASVWLFGFGSGVYLHLPDQGPDSASHVVITAAHVLKGDRRGTQLLLDQSNIWLSARVQHFDYYQPKAKIFKAYRHSQNYDSHDVALLCLKKARKKAAALSKDTPKEGDEAWLVGHSKGGMQGRQAKTRFHDIDHSFFNFFGSPEGLSVLYDPDKRRARDLESFSREDSGWVSIPNIKEENEQIVALPAGTPGDSGGGVFNKKGQLLGLITIGEGVGLPLIKGEKQEGGWIFMDDPSHTLITRSSVLNTKALILTEGPNHEFITNCAPLVCGDDSEALKNCDRDIATQ